MAYLLDEQDDEKRLLEASAPGSAPLTAAGGSAASSPAPSSGSFANLGAYFNANQPQAQQMSTDLFRTLGGGALQASQSGDMGAAAEAKGRLEAATSHDGRTALFDEAGGPNYSAGMAGLDSYLTGRATPDLWAGLKERFDPRLDAVGQPPPPAGPIPSGDAPSHAAPAPGTNQPPQTRTRINPETGEEERQNDDGSWTPTHWHDGRG